MFTRVKQRHLWCLVEVVRHGSLAKAAEALSLTPSACSKTLTELEEIVGEKLMQRTRTGITLTPAGHILHRYASASLSALRHGMDLVAKSSTEAKTTILVGVLPNAAAEVMPRAIQEFKRRNPDIPIRIATGTNRQLMTLLRNGEADFVVGRLAEHEDTLGIHFERLYYERFAFVARPNHPLIVADTISEAEVRNFTLLIPPHGTVIRREIDRFLVSRGLVAVADIVETMSVEFGKSYVHLADAVWIVPWGVVRADIEAGRLAELPFDLSSTGGPVGISTRSEPGLDLNSRELLRCVKNAARLYGANL